MRLDRKDDSSPESRHVSKDAHIGTRSHDI